MRLSFEERGLLRLLRRVAEGGDIGSTAVRFALTERGLVEGIRSLTLTPSGVRLLEELQQRSWLTGDVPVVDVPVD